jgi:hypothetical protein
VEDDASSIGVQAVSLDGGVYMLKRAAAGGSPVVRSGCRKEDVASVAFAGTAPG